MQGRAQLRLDRGEERASACWASVRGGPDADARYLNEDGNTDDRTVMQVRSATPVAPGASARFRIEWDVAHPARQRRARRLGPRLPLHRAVVPEDRRVLEGAVELPPVLRRGPSSSATSASTTSRSRCRAASWSAPPAGWSRRRRTPTAATATASCRRTSTTSRGPRAAASSSGARASTTPATRRSTIRLLLQPEHAHLGDRYLEATKIALRTYGTWSAPYPYPQITVVDPAWGSASGGMEYPTLFTGGRLGPGAARAAEPGGRHDPRGRPPVLVRARGQQRVRGGLARRGLQQLHDGQGQRPLARPRGLGPPLLRRRLRAAARAAAGRSWRRASGSRAAATAWPGCGRAARPT